MNDITGFKELGVLAKKYGFKNILDFSVWVEDNNLADALGIKGEDIIDEVDDKLEKEDKDSIGYKSKILALEILSLPEFKEEIKRLEDSKKSTNNITIEKWNEWANIARDKKKIWDFK